MNNSKIKKRKSKVMQRIKRKFSRSSKTTEPIRNNEYLRLQGQVKSYQWAIDMLKNAFGERVKFYTGERGNKRHFTFGVQNGSQKVTILLEGLAEVNVNTPRQTKCTYIFPAKFIPFSFNDYVQKEKVLTDYIAYLKKLGFEKPKIASTELNKAKQELRKREAKFNG